MPKNKSVAGYMLIGLKAMVGGILAFLPTALIYFAVKWLYQQQILTTQGLGMVLGVLAFILQVYLLGYFLNKFWNWK
ncbi:MAG: hypothetical protein ABEK17_00920 [Candidatus Aenigmatarchaeota archaeon]